MRKPIVAGNWKMNGSRSQVVELVNAINSQIGGLQANGAVEVIVCPPAIFIPQVEALLNESKIKLGGQNAANQTSGAYTGEISPAFLAEFGCSHVILGHSERRQLYGETSELVAEKFCLAQQQGLTPILCVGETQQQREAGDTFAVIDEQLRAVLKSAGIAAFANAVIAYEPVWAIGTGLTATPEQAQDVHQHIRAQLAEHDAEIAAATRLLYGGSVKPDNAKSLFACADIDGGLIGGAALKAADFIAICEATE